MKSKISITLSEDLVRLVDRQAARGESRSEAIEGLLREGLALRLRRAADARDLMLLNRNAEALNAEMADVLEYQDEL
jgi:metal-responsive CopG/Arc/MetJ family transcriptional regulator